MARIDQSKPHARAPTNTTSPIESTSGLASQAEPIDSVVNSANN